MGDNNEPQYELPDFNHPGVALEKKEDAARLFKAISQLPDSQKTAFTLHKLEDLSYKEVSEVMKTSVPAVESLMHRAKQNLRKILEKPA
jgi:RNA polymerase sigma-70 factor (ECF subfamily)